jgi:hypothetical protein
MAGKRTFTRSCYIEGSLDGIAVLEKDDLNMAVPASVLAALLLVGSSEAAWWEGRWADAAMSCRAISGDEQPISLSFARLRFVESECVPLREVASAHALVIKARCRDHGDPAERRRDIVLRPSDGGRAMVMRIGRAEWRLRKCP